MVTWSKKNLHTCMEITFLIAILNTRWGSSQVRTIECSFIFFHHINICSLILYLSEFVGVRALTECKVLKCHNIFNLIPHFLLLCFSGFIPFTLWIFFYIFLNVIQTQFFITLAWFEKTKKNGCVYVRFLYHMLGIWINIIEKESDSYEWEKNLFYILQWSRHKKSIFHVCLLHVLNLIWC